MQGLRRVLNISDHGLIMALYASTMTELYFIAGPSSFAKTFLNRALFFLKIEIFKKYLIHTCVRFLYLFFFQIL